MRTFGDAFMAMLYEADTRFYDLSHFIAACELPLDQPLTSTDPVDVSALINDRAEQLRAKGDAMSRLIAEDLTLIADAAKRPGYSLPVAVTDMESALDEIATRAEKVLRSHGFDCQIPKPVLVDGLLGDGVQTTPEGVYFSRSTTAPLYSEYTYCREIFHILVGTRDPERAVSGIEAGLADLLGYIWLSAELLGPQLARRLFCLHQPISEHRLDAARFWSAVLLERGLSELLRYASKRQSSVYAPGAGSWHPEENDGAFSRLAIELLLKFPPSFVVSAPAFLFARHAVTGLSVLEIGTRAGLNADESRMAAAELTDELGVLSLRKDHIVVTESDSVNVLSQHSLRYAHTIESEGSTSSWAQFRRT